MVVRILKQRAQPMPTSNEMKPELLAELKKAGFPLRQVIYPLGTLQRAFDEMWGIEHYKEPTVSDLIDALHRCAP